MSDFSELLRYDREYLDFERCLADSFKGSVFLPIAVSGLSGGAEDAFGCQSILSAKRITGECSLILVRNDESAIGIQRAVCSLGLRARRFPSREMVFHNISASHDIERERLSVLSDILSGRLDAVIATPSAAVGYTMPRGLLSELSLSVRVGDIISPEDMEKKLSALGFSFVDTVEGRGQFSRRGGIIDLFSGETELPVRIEFFGDEVDRMVFFDPVTQRAKESCNQVSIMPAVEVTVSSGARERILFEIDRLIKKCKNELGLKKLSAEREYVIAGLPLDFRDKYLGLIYPECENLLTYLSGNTAIMSLILGTNAINEELASALGALNSKREAMIDEGLVSEEAAKYSASQAEFADFLGKNITVHTNSFSGGVKGRLAGLFGFRCRPTVSYGRAFRTLVEDLAGYRRSGYRVIIVCENTQGAESLSGELLNEGIGVIPSYDSLPKNIDKAEAGSIFVTVGEALGYDLPSPKIALLSMTADDEGRKLMSNRRKRSIRRRLGKATERLMSYADLSVGDYVVHENYGIGLFEGIQAVTVDGVTKDYITIRYSGTDKLLVPCERLEVVSKYIGSRDENGEVKLSKMGGGDWLRTKTKAKGAVKDIAEELIKLYAERQRMPGFAFPIDSDMENEFAADFEYEETDSQLAAIEEIKRDMMRPQPMNRLLCGDVGYGKTEVALRAAFKAIMGGKQVVMLVPTTILAMQHYQTASSRLRNYPVTVEMLTRFTSPKAEAAILRRAKRGEIDILIGTHKLLSKKLELADVGLLIVDEEQRFGVGQKEKLKGMFKNIDVLTLSATPIPRTLNMAMNGISDISVLDEAPGERHPVQTYVTEHDDGLIFDAVKRELERGGQVLYLYNNVESIMTVADKISDAVPAARVAYAHGRMERAEIEDIWDGLVRGEIDVLVCTTIIETGVDLPNANTLIIENADRFGLSQLHQIRGRVGRSERQAYAYLTYRRGKTLSDIAEKRLSAIREFAEFGAGFKVALRDLEIRGAGNLLGAEQHGYINGVGYDLYVKLLNEAVLEQQGKKEKKPEPANIDVSVSAYIPEKYISAAAKRMEMYKKISLIQEPCDLEDIQDELTDRFGDMPREVERLVNISLARALATKYGIKQIKQKGDTLWFMCNEPDLAIWSELFAKYKSLTFRMSKEGSVAYRLGKGEDPARMASKIMREYYKSEKKDLENEEKHEKLKTE